VVTSHNIVGYALDRK